MKNQKELSIEITRYRCNVESLIESLNARKIELEDYFSKNYTYNIYYDEGGKQLYYTANDFSRLFKKNIDYYEKQRIFLVNVIGVLEKEIKHKNNHMELLIKELIEILKNNFSDTHFDDHKLFEVAYYSDYSNEYESVLLLSKISGTGDNVILIGGNGSGKSNFAKTIKGNDTSSISVIPAQKSLYFFDEDSSLILANREELKSILLENSIRNSKDDDARNYISVQNNIFSKLIFAMRDDYINYLIECDNEGVKPNTKERIYGKVRHVFEIIFPDITININESKNKIECERYGNKFHINSLSEGEKAVIYYAISVLMAKENSFIVVDEPETYLNPSLANILWDTLTKIRADCQFIFITHSVNFVLGRAEAKIFWIKNYEFPNMWKFEPIDAKYELPKILLTEILGSKKPIFFCEGDDKSSLDYQVYQGLFGEEYTIIPVGGHIEVIKYCDVLNKSTWLGIECIGVIDGDNNSNINVSNLREKKIYVMPFNEIEMLLLTDEVINNLLTHCYPEDFINRIESFKNEFRELVKSKVNNIALSKLKNIVEENFRKMKIVDYSDLDSIKQGLNTSCNLNVEAEYGGIMKELSDLLEVNEYENLLKVCNLKKEVSRGLANKYLTADYESQATQRIRTDKTLQSSLKEKYFSFK